jgi:ATP-binding cassette subfamily B multidrug efflux pump
MRYKQSVFDEKKLGKAYDMKLLTRLYPYARPYTFYFMLSVLLVIFITLFDLSLPYVTKIAIDTYIIPQTISHNNDVADKTSGKTRYMHVDIADSDIAAIVDRYSDLFTIHASVARIAFDDLGKLDKKDLISLRKSDIEGLGVVVLIFIFLVIANFIFNFAQVLIMEYTGQLTMHDLRMHLFDHIQKLSVTFFSHNPVGRLVTRVTNDIQNMYELFTSIIAFVFKDLFLLLGISVVMLSIHWKLALISFTVIPFVLMASLYFSKQARDAFRTLRIKIAEINTRFSETIGGIKVVQLFLHENKNYRSFKKINHENYVAGVRQIHVFALFMPVVETFSAISLAIVIYFGGGGVVSENISLGALVAFISYMKMFFRPIRDIAEKYNILQNAMSSAERIFLIFDNENVENGESESAPVPLDVIQDIAFERVGFGYTETETVLNQISFKIKKGETLAIVGPTGSGKTSLVNLIVRFYDIRSGSILVNGTQINHFDLSVLRSKIALVPQDPFIFSGTIKENILFGDNNISESRINQILEDSRCKSFVNRLPKGVLSELSEGGKSISSGERQLISIARAFAKDPEIMILDEATSYIDSQTEQDIKAALVNLMKNRTSIIVAHRLSTARYADTIIALYNGKIIETGSHDELMENKGYYYKLNQL